jgi:hypothetical protein
MSIFFRETYIGSFIESATRGEMIAYDFVLETHLEGVAW